MPGRSPYSDHYARCVRLLGPAGSGQLAKMVNQVCIAGVVQGLAEGLDFAERAGPRRGRGRGRDFQGRGPELADGKPLPDHAGGEYEHGFAVDWMRKDLDMVLAEGERLGLPLALTRMVDGFYADVQAMGGGRWDTSSLLARLKGK